MKKLFLTLGIMNGIFLFGCVSSEGEQMKKDVQQYRGGALPTPAEAVKNKLSCVYVFVRKVPTGLELINISDKDVIVRIQDRCNLGINTYVEMKGKENKTVELNIPQPCFLAIEVVDKETGSCPQKFNFKY